MGVLRSTMKSYEEEREEFHGMLLRANGRKDKAAGLVRRAGDVGRGCGCRLVSVTGGLSFVGMAIVNLLLDRGYTVRLVLQNEEEMEKYREMEEFGETRDGVWAVVANVMDMDSLCRAFDGCSGVFHTSAFIDSSGVSGYNKHMADMEAKAAAQVIQACVTTTSVTKCVFTSSLLACAWQPKNLSLDRHRPTIIDETCWSDEALCREKKLWFALGKTMAEKAAWRVAKEGKLKLATICPGLTVGPEFSNKNSTGSIAYMKGCQELFAKGLLATINVGKVAEAHVFVYEAMADTACGRYICFDRIIHGTEDATQLERKLGVPNRISTSIANSNRSHQTRSELSNRKLTRLLSASRRRCFYDMYSLLD